MFINKLLSSIFINTLVIYIISSYLPSLGFVINFKTCSLEIYLIVGGIFWFINGIVKKIVKLFALPLNLITLGIVGILINIGFIYLFAYVINTYLSTAVSVEVGSIVQVFIVSILIYILNLLFKKL